jgi:NADH-quinone oxidoreductase subunit J
MSLELIALVVLSLLALVSAVVVVFHRNPVVCALALAFNLVSIAGFYLLLSAQFLGLLQVIVYAGAIMVLILFVIMLLNLPEEARRPQSGFFQKWLGLIFSVALVAILAVALKRGMAGASYPEPSSQFGTIGALGTDLFTKFFYPFEAISLLLIVAMIGAVLLAKRRL